MRQNLQKARAAQSRNGMGPIYRHLLDHELDADRRYRRLGRPRLLLEQLEAGETVTVPLWRVPVELRPPDCGLTMVVSRDT